MLQKSHSEPVAVPRSHSFGPSIERQLPPAPISGRTPGRRGEKRRRPQDEEEDQKKRKNGKVVLDRERSRTAEGDGEEDIFGKHTAVKSGIKFELPPPSKAGAEGEGDEQSQARSGEEPPSTAKKRPRVPQQILDNKAVGLQSCLVSLC